MAQISSTAAFTQYLEVVNQALGQHRDEQPWKLFIQAGEKLAGDKRIGVAMYDEDADNPHDYFTITMDEGTFSMKEHGKSDPDVEWKVPEAHVREVINNPAPYRANPAKLDLDWLKRRIGV